MRWLKRNKLLLGFVALNLLIAAPADAGLRNGVCESGGEVEPCCVSCWIFCGCEFN